MKRIVAVLLLLFLASCAPPAHNSGRDAGAAGTFFVDAVVESVAGNQVVLSLRLPEFAETPDLPMRQIAREVVRKSLFLEGLRTDIDGLPVLLSEVRGNMVTAVCDRPPAFAVGASLRLRVPRKTIAVVDFEVIKGKGQEAGRVTLEGLTSALIDSGHFVVVERAKLKPVIDELLLRMSGMTGETSVEANTLIPADLILTGTLADMGDGTWDINLRLVNVRSGQAMAAISLRPPMFKPAELRDAGSLDEGFEGASVNSSWAIGYKGKGVFNVKHDTTQGAEGSRHSLRMDFNLQNLQGMGKVYARLENMKKRDLNLYSGVEFSVKADPEVTGLFRLLVSERDDPNAMDAWVAHFTATPGWQRVRIPFADLGIGRAWVKEGARKYGARAGNQVLDLGRVEAVAVGAYSEQNPPVRGAMWIDEVRFYRE